MGIVSLFAAASVFVAVAAAPPTSANVAGVWATVVDCDAVRVELDTGGVAHGPEARQRATAEGPLRARLRWTLRDADVSPSAWALGVRTTLDDLDVDCASGSSRTVASRAFTAGGEFVEGASAAVEAPAWRRHAAGSVGALVTAAVCRAAGRAVGAAAA